MGPGEKEHDREGRQGTASPEEVGEGQARAERLQQPRDRALRGRGQDSEEVIAKRMAQAVAEMTHYAEYDYLIVNDDFDLALSDLKTIIRAERLRLGRQLLRHDALISKLLAD